MSLVGMEDQVHQGSFYHEADDFFTLQGPTGALLPLPTSDQPLFGISESLVEEFTNLPSASNWLAISQSHSFWEWKIWTMIKEEIIIRQVTQLRKDQQVLFYPSPPLMSSYLL
ncbi:uncharacterized protein PGTG_16876 [Puccinia graminis f. sp. tritici CRL 75-36-700-3]|uniref:Uncharacterized protein n=1 Tax=Puccinia graminis f. sp. tritici (strain CRL 75-36-700-3 / race SCCL) TaxID=418459 RepID=E3L3K6_PUCGT|nr:uncharacterized protein PGTG_16876 [Puccinia graminis f. sp. tritici CRL 75-36-700-3]EFP91131.1 hypothetical protein PGTG_16876 [Puccinia graminis f. sp. tritici CRL 75-36-700-3]